MLTGSAKEYRRQLAVKWAQEGLKQSDIAERLGVTQGCISQWVKRAREGGDEALKTRSRSGHPAKLPPQRVSRVLEALEDIGAAGFGYADGRWTTQRIADAIAQLTGVQYTQSHMSKLLRKWQWDWRSLNSAEGEYAPEKIEKWRLKLLPAVEEERQAPVLAEQDGYQSMMLS